MKELNRLEAIAWCNMVVDLIQELHVRRNFSTINWIEWARDYEGHVHIVLTRVVEGFGQIASVLIDGKNKDVTHYCKLTQKTKVFCTKKEKVKYNTHKTLSEFLNFYVV